MKIALASLDQIWGDKEGNFQSCIEIVKQAKDLGAELIVFPEMTLTGFYLDPALLGESKTNSKTLRQFGDLSRNHKLTIIFGACLFEDTDGLARNYLCVAEPNGTSDAIYAKIHTFSHAGEDQVIANGLKTRSFDVSGVTFGASICYDLRFPSLYASLSEECVGSVVIANWPDSRRTHWFALLKARAIENQMFMMGVNRIGIDGNGINYSKMSCIINPYGEFVNPIFSDSAIDLFEVDPKIVDQYRQAFPTLNDRQIFSVQG
jgi:predicted amidohydrolase